MRRCEAMSTTIGYMADSAEILLRVDQIMGVFANSSTQDCWWLFQKGHGLVQIAVCMRSTLEPHVQVAEQSGTLVGESWAGTFDIGPRSRPVLQFRRHSPPLHAGLR